MMANSFTPTPAQIDAANRRFPPVAARNRAAATGAALQTAAPQTSVTIVAAADYSVDLVATIFPGSPAPPGGERLVAGLQTVNRAVYIPFNRDLPLWWFAAVQKKGEIAANTDAFAYSSDADSFTMQMNPAITLTHDAKGWHIPSYDSTLYAVTVGFGLGTDLVFCAYAAPAAPLASLPIPLGGYQLARSSGGQGIGDIVTADQTAWSMPLGAAYLLTFDASGVGKLTTR